MGQKGIDRSGSRVGTWAAFGLVIALMTAGRIMEYRVLGEPEGGYFADAIMGIAFLAFPAVGALILSRQPGHVYGRLLLGVGGMAALLVAASAYAAYELGVAERITPLSTFCAWLYSWLWYPIVMIIPTFVFLLFPTGRYHSPGWRWVGRATVGLMAVVTVPAMLTDRLTGDNFEIENPIGVPAIGDVEEQIDLLSFLLFPLILASFVSLFFRYRKGNTEERQQLKWVGLAGFVFGVGMFAGDMGADNNSLVEAYLFPMLLLMLPVAFGISIMKYRLYEIDVIINRTLVYGALTILLIGAYLTIVFALQASLGRFTEDSQLAVAGSTLAVAALFQPLRARVQGFIDRRFYRRKYDAAKTVEAFNLRLRDEMGLEAVHHDVIRVVIDTMQPRYVSLWTLRSGASR